jgi:hypothetical protein
MRAIASVSSVTSFASFTLCALLGVLASGCTYSMHEYQAAGYAAVPAAGGPRQAEWIHARAEQRVILGVTDNTDYIDHAYADLLDQCTGEVVGLNTRFSTSLGFLSYKNVVEMRAMCIRVGPTTSDGGAVPAAPPAVAPGSKEPGSS